MTRFEIIPYAFELARIVKGCENITMRYDEYPKYVKMFDELDEDMKRQLVMRVRERNLKNHK